MKWCSRCRTIKYCSPECQKKDWPKHKPICANLDFDKNKEYVREIRSFVTPKVHHFLAAFSYYSRQQRRANATCWLIKDIDGKFTAKLGWSKEVDGDLSSDKENIIVLYVLPDDADKNFKVVFSFDTPAALREYELIKDRLHNCRSLELTSTPMTPGFPPLEVVNITSDEATSMIVL